jgi:hypothetical protein
VLKWVFTMPTPKPFTWLGRSLRSETRSKPRGHHQVSLSPRSQLVCALLEAQGSKARLGVTLDYRSPANRNIMQVTLVTLHFLVVVVVFLWGMEVFCLQCWESNQGPCTWQASVLPLNYVPNSWFLETGSHCIPQAGLALAM